MKLFGTMAVSASLLVLFTTAHAAAQQGSPAQLPEVIDAPAPRAFPAQAPVAEPGPAAPNSAAPVPPGYRTPVPVGYSDYPGYWYFHGGWGYIGPTHLGHGSAFGFFGYQGPPGWTPRGYYGGWGYRAPGFSANFAPFAPPPPPPGTLPPSTTLIVKLPADADLSIDDQPTSDTSDTRIFSTRKLAPGQTYYYHLKAQVVRAGQTQVMNKRVAVRTGEVTRVTLELPAAAVNGR